MFGKTLNLTQSNPLTHLTKSVGTPGGCNVKKTPKGRDDAELTYESCYESVCKVVMVSHDSVESGQFIWPTTARIATPANSWPIKLDYYDKKS